MLFVNGFVVLVRPGEEERRVHNATEVNLIYLQQHSARFNTAVGHGGHLQAPVVGLATEWSKAYDTTHVNKKSGQLEARDKLNGPRPPEPERDIVFPSDVDQSRCLSIFSMDSPTNAFKCHDVIDKCERGWDMLTLEGMRKKDLLFGAKSIGDEGIIPSRS